MKKHLFICFVMSVMCGIAYGQNVPQNILYSRVYSFIDELANDGFIDINSAVKPYSRQYIAQKLAEAEKHTDKLSIRQIQDIEFFKNDYALEYDTLPNSLVSYSDNKNYSATLLQPAFHYRSKILKARITPILGMNILSNKKGIITERRWGGEIALDVANHISVWGSMCENRFDGSRLKPSAIGNKQLGALLYPSKILLGVDQTRPFGYKTDFLYNHVGYQYDLNNHYGGDFTEVKGGIKFYADFGSIGLVKDNVVWGDNNNGSNILSGRAPSFPMITLNVKPCKWFELNYIHGWLVSNVIDSTNYYVEEANGSSIRHYRARNKFIAANFMTFKPMPKLNISIGNSIVYAEKTIQPAYLIPIAFYKGLDKILTRGLGIENQNSQIFMNISSRNIKHLHLYFSAYLDEVSFKRFLPKSAEKNPISYKLGFDLTNFPLQNIDLTAEMTRTNIITYKHSIDVLSWENNSVGLGHYLGDNAMDLYLAMRYMPIRGLDLKLSYTGVYKYNDYDFVRGNIRQIISQKPFEQKSFTNNIIGFNALYEVFNNVYACVNLQYNNAKGYDLSANMGKVNGENTLDEKGNLNRFSPKYYQGKNLTATCGLTFNF